MSAVTVIVKLHNSDQLRKYVRFELTFRDANQLQIGDTICFGDHQMVVRLRRFHMSTHKANPDVFLHTGLVNQRGAVTPEMLVPILQAYENVDQIETYEASEPTAATS